ncbi:MAG: radical SAM protein [Candidatus Saccharibacteria bacterium]
MELTWSTLIKQLSTESFIKGTPLTMSFELTPRCNQKCNMCYVSSPANDQAVIDRELTAEQWIQMGREARDAGLLILVLTGGEVFLREDFRQIYEGLLNLGLMIQINTNGTLINEETVEWLKKIPPSRVFITLYGACHDTCAKVTGLGNSYERTVWAIDALIAAGIPVSIRTTVVKDNAHEYKEFVDFVYARDRQLGIVNYISPRREGCNSAPEQNRLDPADLVEYEANINAYGKIKQGDNAEKAIEFDDPVYINDEQQSDPREAVRYPAFTCGSGRSSGWVTWDGRLTGCGLLNEPASHPMDVGFTEAWNELKTKMAQVPACQECVSCEFRSTCMTCPARLISETGSYDKAASYLCEAAKNRSKDIKL